MSTRVAAQPAAAGTASDTRSHKGAEIIVEYLIKEKVPYLFGNFSPQFRRVDFGD